MEEFQVSQFAKLLTDFEQVIPLQYLKNSWGTDENENNL